MLFVITYTNLVFHSDCVIVFAMMMFREQINNTVLIKSTLLVHVGNSCIGVVNGHFCCQTMRKLGTDQHVAWLLDLG